MGTNINLHKAKQTRNDEYYTQYEDIEKEMVHYTACFKNRVVYCNCDNPEYSNFWKYFHLNFGRLGLKQLIATYYSVSQAVCKIVYGGGY